MARPAGGENHSSGSFPNTGAHKNTGGSLEHPHKLRCMLHSSTNFISDTRAIKKIAAKIVGQFENSHYLRGFYIYTGCTLPLDCVILSERANLRKIGTDEGTRRHMAPVSACADMQD